MLKTTKFIEDIYDASQNDRLIFFVGAGVSRLSGFPSWNDVVEKFNSHLYNDSNRTISSDEYLKIPQIYYDVKGADNYNQILQDIFNIDKQSNIVHDKLLKINPKHIITTNYDTLIESAAIKNGWAFSKICSDADVANVTNSHYLIKAHGDFTHGYNGLQIVLKEQDYLNYDTNFPLISNLIKSYFATYQIVFIGYGLNDYNIRILLNWVQQVQKGSFKRPYFIYNENTPIDSNDLKYYEGKGVNIIDSTSTITEDDFKTRYLSILDKIINCDSSLALESSDECINYLHSLITKLSKINYLRKKDICRAFKNRFTIGEDGFFNFRNNSNMEMIIKQFYSLIETNNSNSIEMQIKLTFIKDFFDYYGIKGIRTDSRTISIELSKAFTNVAYHMDCTKMEKKIASSSENIQNDFIKAYYLASMYRLQDSFKLYSQVIVDSGRTNDWLTYYLSQINRYRIYQTMKNIYSGMQNEFIDYMNEEMSHINIKNIFPNMPIAFQYDYAFLRFLSTDNFLHDELLSLYETEITINKKIRKGSYDIGGITDSVKTDLKLDELLHFLYDNYIWFDNFYSLNQFVKNSIFTVFKKSEYDRIKALNDNSLWINMSCAYTPEIDYNRFVNMTKSFYHDDFLQLEKLCSINNFKMVEQNEIETYICNIISALRSASQANELNNRIHNIFKSILYLAGHLKLSNEIVCELLKTILFDTNDYHFNSPKRLYYIWRIANLYNFECIINSDIELFITKLLSNSHENYSSRIDCSGYVHLLKKNDSNYISKILSDYILNTEKLAPTQLTFLYNYYSILSVEAQIKIVKNIEIKTPQQLTNALVVQHIPNTYEYNNIIIDCLTNALKKATSNNNSKDLFSYCSDSLALVQNYFLGHIKNINMHDYMGISDEHDFFIDPNSFDYDKFKLGWLKKYIPSILKKIFACPNAKTAIGQKLKEALSNKHIDDFYIALAKNYYL